MNSIKKALSKNIQGKKVLSLFIVTNMVYLVMIFVTIPQLMEFSNGIKILDMLPFGYSYEYLSQLFSELGTEGRHAYLYYQIPLDMVYPFLFGISYCLMMAFFLQKIKLFKKPYVLFCLLPMIAAIFDYLENIGTISLLQNYPNVSKAAVQLNSGFTIIKSLSTSLFFIVLIVVLIIFTIKKVRKK